MPRILIVDDEPNIVTLISRYAQREGYDIVTASDGREAIEKCRSDGFDLIVMDVMMPDTDGFETLEKIRSEDALKDSKVCMMTGTLTDEVRGRAEKLGAVGCIEKPLDAAVLYDIIGKV